MDFKDNVIFRQILVLLGAMSIGIKSQILIFKTNNRYTIFNIDKLRIYAKLGMYWSDFGIYWKTCKSSEGLCVSSLLASAPNVNV